MRISAWDLETSSLNGSFGMILCACVGDVGSKDPVELFSIRDYKRKGKNIFDAERRMLIDLSARLLDSDAWLTWYGRRFDAPMLQTRLLYHRLPVMPTNHPHIDGWYTARFKMKLHSNRLASAQDFLGVKHKKTSIDAESWILALSGDDKAFGTIEDHCVLDIHVLREVYDVIKPLVAQHPNKGLITPDCKCPVCGSNKIQRRGWRLTRTRKYRRYQCQDCSAWFSNTKAEKIADRA